MSLLTQSQLFSASTNSYPDSVIEKDQFRAHTNAANLNNCSPATGVTEPHGKLNAYHQLAGDESSNRKTNGRTNQTSRRCKKSKKSTNFDTSSFKANDDNQENKHSNKHPTAPGGKKNKNRNNKNVNNNINLDKDSNHPDHHQTNRKNNLNDRLSSGKKMQRNSSSGTEEGYSSLDDCGSTSSAHSCAIPESPDLIVALSNDEERGDPTNEPASKGLHHLHSYRSHHHMLVNSKKEDDNSDANQSDDHLDLNSSDRSTVSTVSSSDLNLMHNNEDLNSTAEEAHFQQQDEFEQSTEQYLSSIWQQLDVGKGGYLTLQELFIVCEHCQMGPMDEGLVKQLFDRLDEDKDGKVSFDELLKQLTSSSTTGDDDEVTNIASASALNENDYNLEEHIDSYPNDYQGDYQLTNSNNLSNKSADKAMNEQTALGSPMNAEFEGEPSGKSSSGLSLALSPYSAYKNYFSAASHHNDSSFNKEATYDDERSHLKNGDDADNVDHMTDSNPFYSLDSKLLPNAVSGKHQRKNSFSAANASDCLNVPSIGSQPPQSANSLSCCCSTLNNQSKSDYGFTSSGCSKVFCHKRTGSLGNAHPQTPHAGHKQAHCNQYRNENCNELLGSSSASNTSSSANGSSANPSSSSASESSVNQTLSKNSHQTSSTLSAISEQRPDLGELNAKSCAAANCCCSSKANNKLLSESGQGDGCCSGKRGPIDKFSVNLSSRYSPPSSNQSTPELEHTQLLSSLNSMHQFNSSHSYHHQTSSLTKEHHLPQQQANDEDFCNLTGFGNLLSLDPFNYG